MADLGQQLSSAVRQAAAEAASYLALVTRTNPRGSADDLLKRPDTDAVLQGMLDSGRLAAEDVVRQHWGETGAAGSDDETLGHLLNDVDRMFGNLAHLRGLVRHAHASVPQRHFIRGVSTPGDNPSQRAAEERSDAVRDALLGWARTTALRAKMTERMAEGAGRTAAALAGAQARTLQGQRLMKRWRAHKDSPSCCTWCRRLDGVTIGLGDSFEPYLGGPVALPQGQARRVRTAAGERQFGLPIGERITYTHPPRPYRGKLQGPLLHPFCRCWLEIARVSDSGTISVRDMSGGSADPGGYLTAASIRDMPEDQYQAGRAFLEAAVLSLDDVLKRLAGGGG